MTRYRMASLDYQAFGLASDLTTFIEEYGAGGHGRLVLWGGTRHGVPGEWTFRTEDLAEFDQNAEL